MSNHFEPACQLAISIANISVKKHVSRHDTMSNECTTKKRP